MSSQLEGSSAGSRQTKKTEVKRRSWTQTEEGILIAALKDLIVQGWRSDNGFRGGYLKKLEGALKKVFPSTDLKGMPHINSKLGAWKKFYASLNGILSRSGVGFNSDGNHLIECEDETWEQIIKADPNARNMRFKSWPYYEDWTEIFGKDRANGDGAEDIFDAYNAIREEEVSMNGGSGGDYTPVMDDIHEDEGEGDRTSHSHKTVRAPREKQKKRKVSEDVQAICEVLGEIGRKTDERLTSLKNSHTVCEVDMGTSKKEAFEKLSQMQFLSLEQQIDACEILYKDADKLEIFRCMPDSMKPHYVDRLLQTRGS